MKHKFLKYGKKMRLLRQRAKLTQTKVADELNLESTQFISNIERGLAVLPAKFVKQVAEVYGESALKIAKMATRAKSEVYIKNAGIEQ